MTKKETQSKPQEAKTAPSKVAQHGCGKEGCKCTKPCLHCKCHSHEKQ